MRHERRVVDQAPLVFYYSGEAFPNYAKQSLSIALKDWDGEIVLLHDSNPTGISPRIEMSDFSEWYDPEPFRKFREASPLSMGFRNGFWFHTAERFFVLSQWAARNDVRRFVHAEVDVLLGGTQHLPSRLDLYGQGMFYPRASKEFAGASFLYVNSLPVLDEFLDFAVSRAELGYEMKILAEFLDSHPGQAFALPSHAAIEERLGAKITWEFIPPSVTGGLVDVGAIGTWLVGSDPKSYQKSPVFNRTYFEGHGSQLLRDMRFSFVSLKPRVAIRSKFEKRSFPVLALHIHSKKISRASSRIGILGILFQAKLPFSTIVVWQNLPYYLGMVIGEGRDRLYSTFRRRLSASKAMRP